MIGTSLHAVSTFEVFKLSNLNKYVELEVYKDEKRENTSSVGYVVQKTIIEFPLYGFKGVLKHTEQN